MAAKIDPNILKPSSIEILGIGMENPQRHVQPENQRYRYAEIEHLHHIPSYLTETNIHRHFYYFCAEKNLYFKRLPDTGLETETERLIAWYEPHWKRLRESLLPHKVLRDDHRLSQWREWNPTERIATR